MLINKIASLINQSVTPFHAVATIANELRTAGSREVGEKEFWNLGVGSYHVKRNDSSIIAFHLPVGMAIFVLAVSHTLSIYLIEVP